MAKLKNSLKYIFVIILTLSSIEFYAQTSDDHYKRPLKDVFDEIENKFNVKLKYSEDLIENVWLDYADWRFRPDLEKTLNNVLLPLDLMFIKENKNTYKIRKYRYALISVEDGKQILENLSTLYNDMESWEKRKEELRECIFKALNLELFPEKPDSKPILSNKRNMNGYIIENIAIETLPGLYVCGSLYRPIDENNKIPIILCPNGHFKDGRYRENQQIRCAMLARMGAVAFSYDLFAWGESLLQFKPEDHKKSLAMTIQALNAFRIIDFLVSLEYTDSERIGITGGSGGGSQTMLITALDDRIKVSVPVVMLSCYFYGGCPCESGKPVHLCGGGTNNVELASMAAPRPQLVISDGDDWTAHVPEIEFSYLQKIYDYYEKTEVIENAHFANEGHDYGISKRMAMYEFMTKYLELNMDAVKDENGNIDELKVTIEEESAMYVFGKNGELLPSNAIKNFEELEKIFELSIEK